MILKKIYFLFCLFLLLGSYAQSQGIETLRTQARDAFLDERQPTPNRCKEILDALRLNGDGSFSVSSPGVPGLSYFDTDDWPKDHLKDLTDLAIAFAEPTFPPLGTIPGTTPAVLYDDILEDELINGLNFWYSLSSDPSCNNSVFDNCPCATSCPCSEDWQDNYIEKQKELQRIGILFWDVLSTSANSSLLNNIINDLPTDVRDCNSSRDFTGANLTNVAGAMIARGILDQNDDLINDGRSGIQSALEFAPYPQREGIQRDFSFHQHGPLLYSGGYGQSFLEVVGLWGTAARQTMFEFDETPKENLIKFVLNGTRMMTVGNHTDYSANGRYLARVYPGSNTGVPSHVMNWIINMATSGSEEAMELGDMQTAINTGNFQNIEGNTYFWKSDYVCNQKNDGTDYFSSIKMCSSRTLGTEEESDNNLKGYWLPYGSNFIYLDRNEYIKPDPSSSGYINIFPYWDWARIPGVTSVDLGIDAGLTIVPELEDVDEEHQTQSANFVGSAGNKNYATTVMLLDKDYTYGGADNNNVSAKKAWFHFGDEIVALGTDISSTHPAQTTINQCLESGNILVDPGATTGTTRSILHDNIAYIFPNEPIVSLTQDEQSGVWDDINDGEDEDIEDPRNHVFKAWINHADQSASNATSYYYIIAPGQLPSNYTDANSSVIIEVLSNGNDVQAVKKEGANNTDLAGIVYYPNGSTVPSPVNVGDDNTQLFLRASHPCALLYDQSQQEVCISSPDRNHEEIVLTVTDDSGSNSNITFTLPRGEEAGKSECVRFSDFEVNQTCRSNKIEVQLNALMNVTGGGNLQHTWVIDGGDYDSETFGGELANPTININPNEGYGPFTFTHTVTLNGGSPISSTQVIMFNEMNSVPPITGTVTIDPAYNGGDPVMVISGNLTIEDGAHLTISSDMTLMFCGSDSRLIVEPGGYVAMHGTLTDFNGQTWKGVEVEGISNLSHFGSNWYEQGRFAVRPGATIQNAQVAIEVGNSQGARGGIVACSKASFLNNRRGIVYHPYSFHNHGLVRQCNFVVDDSYPHAGPFEDFVNLSGILGFSCEGTSFTNNMVILDANSQDDYGVGIRAFDSSFGVGKHLKIPSTFNNFGTGVSVRTPQITNNRTHYTIANSEFNYCFVGISNSQVIGANILDNRFNMGAVPPNDIKSVTEPGWETDPVQAGVVYEGSVMGMNCEGNLFINGYSGPNEIITVGIFCDNIGDYDNEIRRNTFGRMTVGNLAVGVNGTVNNPSDIRGLTYFCNTNNELNKSSFDYYGQLVRGYDISVPGKQDYPGIIRSIQGVAADEPENYLAAGNTFSEETDASPRSGIRNRSNSNGGTTPNINAGINYWYFEEDDMDGVYEWPSTSGAVEELEVDNDNTCESVEIIPPCCDGFVTAGIKSEYYQNKSTYNALKANFAINPTPTAPQTLASYRSKMDRAAYQVVLRVMNDTLNFNVDTLYTWIRNMDNVGAELWLAKEYLGKGEGAMAIAVLDNVPTNFSLSAQESNDLQSIKELTQLLMNDNPKNLSSTTLETIATYDEAGGQTEFWAKNILSYYGANYSPEYFFGTEEVLRRENTEEANLQSIQKNYLEVSPNPAKDFVNFKVQGVKENKTSILEVIDINGRVLKIFTDLREDQSITWSTKNLSSGIYFYRLLSNDGKVESGKIVINK